MSSPDEAAPRPTAARLLLRLVLGAGTFLIAGFLGRATILDGQTTNLIWPAAGVAGLWLGSGTRATWPTDIAALGLATYVVISVSGAAPALALVLVVVNIVQAVTFVVLVRRWVPGLWGFGGRDPLLRLVHLGSVTLAALLACLIGALLGTAGLSLLQGAVEPISVLVWWGRTCVAVIVIVTLGVLIGQPLATAGSRRAALRRARQALTPGRPARLLEAIALVAASAVLYVEMFTNEGVQPLAFLVLVMSVWTGIRFAPLAVTLHGLAMGAAGIAFTLAGVGPFAVIEDLHSRAMIAQIFVATAVLTGLALAFSRAERDQANRELVAARQAADERAHLLDAVLESMTEGIVVLDESGAVLVRNRAARELASMVGGPHDRLQPAASYGLHHPNGVPIEDQELPAARALRGESVAPMDLHLRLSGALDGRVLEVTAQPLARIDPAAPRRAMVNTRDVTVDRQHRDTLSSFAGVVAHDLSNPLTVVDGWAEALRDEFEVGAVSPVVGGLMVARIQDATAHMRQFIGDLLSYTIARDQSLRAGPVDLTATVRSLADLWSTSSASPVIAVADDLRVWADPGLVRQLLDNLLGNAVKYVAPGVRPMIEVTGSVDGDWLEVRIADNGVGVPEHQREAIFESFHRAHGERWSGTGLGLAICRRIVDRHGGTIHAAPGPRDGSVFVLQLPRLASPSEQTRSELVPGTRPIRLGAHHRSH